MIDDPPEAQKDADNPFNKGKNLRRVEKSDGNNGVKLFIHPVKLEFTPRKLRDENGKIKQQEPKIFNATVALKQFAKVVLSVKGTYICDAKGEHEFNDVSDFPKTEEEFDKFFDLSQQTTGGRSTVVYMYLKSVKILRSIKQDDEVWRYLDSNGIYLNNRGFVQIENQVSIGALLYLQPKVSYYPEHAKKLANDLHQFV